MTNVTNPAWGIPAAPMLAAVAVILKICYFTLETIVEYQAKNKSIHYTLPDSND
jgi:hypothetical protein